MRLFGVICVYDMRDGLSMSSIEKSFLVWVLSAGDR